MAWMEDWRSISARIEGLMKAGEYFQAGMNQKASDQYGVLRKSIVPEVETIHQLLHDFYMKYYLELPINASESINQFINAGWKDKIDETLKAFAAILIFRGEFEFLIKDSETEVINLTELSFEHLRRSIVVNKEIAAKWVNAFNEHETACEKLGAVHLLSHGLWAFKVTGIGAATDLVFNDPVEGHSSIIKRTARGLVLTEWKLVKTAKQLNEKAQEGRLQAAKYSKGILGGSELKAIRYIVLVSKSDLTAPNDVNENGVIYRHIVIPVQPESPSASSRKR